MKDKRILDAKICFSCGDMEITDNLGNKWGVAFESPDSETRAKFDVVFARMGMKQFKPGAKE